MKTKKFNKKLRLNKKTVAHLINVNMNDIKGGNGTTGTVDTCLPIPGGTYCIACYQDPYESRNVACYLTPFPYGNCK
jgi:hypothetical protein